MKKNNLFLAILLSFYVLIGTSCGGTSTSQSSETDSLTNQNVEIEDDIKKIAFEIVADSGTIELVKGEEGSPSASFKEEILVVTEVPSQTNLDTIQAILQRKQNYTGDAKQALAEKKKNYLKGYLEFNSEDIGMATGWEKNTTLEVIYNDNYFTTIAFYLDEYGGGAHGNFVRTYLILDLKNGKQISLSDVFDEKGLASLKDKLQDKALKFAKEQGASSLEDYGFFDPQIELTKNFTVTEKGLEFVYQQGEVAPHAMYPPSFLFEWNEIKDIMKADASVRSLIK